jgi:hypothetical protein
VTGGLVVVVTGGAVVGVVTGAAACSTVADSGWFDSKLAGVVVGVVTTGTVVDVVVLVAPVVAADW